MAKLPEDLKLAIEGLRTLEEKFLTPLRRLEDVVRVCIDSQNRIEEAEKKFAQVQVKIVEVQNLAQQQEERSRSRLKSTMDQLGNAQTQWAKAESEHKQRLVAMEQQLAQVEADYVSRLQRRDQLAQETEEGTKRLQELRERIRHAQTMEP